MNDHKKYSQARNQLYHLKVLVFALDRDHAPKHPTKEYSQAMHTLQRVVEELADAFMAGEVVAINIDRYTAVPLPGFDPPTVLERLDGTPPKEAEEDDLYWEMLEKRIPPWEARNP